MELLEFFQQLDENLNTFLMNAGIMAPLLSSCFIMLEGTLAFLPMFVFLTVNLLTMGQFFGIIISYICTVFGNFMAFFLCRIGLAPLFKKLIKNSKHLKKFINMISRMKFSKLVLIISIPFTPPSFVNFAAGLSNIPKKKYFYAVLFGKIPVIIFWGVLGTSLVDCLKNPIMLIKVILLILICNLISKFFNKHLDLDNIFEENNKKAK